MPAAGPTNSAGTTTSAGATLASATTSPSATTSARREVATVALVMAAAAAIVLFAASRTWVTVRFARPRPLSDLAINMTGRKLEAGITPLALVVLAAIVAILASGAVLRRVVGAVVGLVGTVLVWRAVVAATVDEYGKASSLVGDRAQVGVLTGTAAASPSRLWPVIVAVAGVAVLICGVAIVLRSRRWPNMSSKYDAPSAASMISTSSEPVNDAADPATKPMMGPVTDDAAWNGLDRGEDPTVPRG